MRYLSNREIGTLVVAKRFKDVLLVAFFLSASLLRAGLSVSDIEEVYGKNYEVIGSVPGRPWIEVQYRYKIDSALITCNIVKGRCLWIDFYFEDKQVNERLVFDELDKLFPGEEWDPVLFHGRLRWWFNAEEDRVTLRAKGFALHMNEYIKNVLSRREQWQF